MNRIILRVEFLDLNGLRLELLHIDKRFLAQTEKDYIYFCDDDASFLIYSKDTMKIYNSTLRLPDAINHKKNSYLIHYFDNEMDRYDFLKGLAKCLCLWNDNFTLFKKDPNHNKRNNKLIMQKNFWII